MIDTAWKKAKIYSNNNNRSTDWSYIYMVYTYLGGNNKGIEVEYNELIYRLMGSYSERFDILYNERNDSIELAPTSVITKAKKSFITLDSDNKVSDILVDDFNFTNEDTTNLVLKSGNPIRVYKKYQGATNEDV